MKLHYSSEKLEKILSDERKIRAHYGNLASSIMSRMHELNSAANLSEISHLPPPKRHKLSGDKQGLWAVRCSDNYRLVFKPIGEYREEDLKSMIEIKIMGVEDYH